MSDRAETASLLTPTRRQWPMFACALAALVWLLGARVMGPSDLWDQTQPKTVSYTADIISNGRWVLPRERGEQPATKPPFYNWLAVPTVLALGSASELGHKFPSVVALCVCWVALVRWGRAIRIPGIDPARAEVVGWLTGVAFVANYAIFKLGYLARPDMLLTMWLILGWMAATAVLMRDDWASTGAGKRWPVLFFWLCTGLAALTKGPAALSLPAFAIIAAPFVAGSWRAAGRFGWWWGTPLALVIVGSWLGMAWRVDPAHVRDELWYHEIYGRVTGLGREGGSTGPMGLLERLANMPVYFVVRFLPWSLLSIAAVDRLWRRTHPGGMRKGVSRPWRELGRGGRMLQAAALFMITVIAFYTFSAGKRADYIAAAYGPGAVLAAWFIACSGAMARRAATWAAPAAAFVLLFLTVNNERQPVAPVPGFGDRIMAFAREARAAMDEDPRPIAFWRTGTGHVQAMLGASEPDTSVEMLGLIDRGEPCWIAAGGYLEGRWAFEVWLPKIRPRAKITPVVRSAVMPDVNGWLIQVTLYRVDPGPA